LAGVGDAAVAVHVPGFGLLGRCFVARRETRVDLVVPAASNTEAGLAIFIIHATRDLVCRGGFPAAGFEVKDTDFTCGPILDLHRPVVIYCGRAGDDANDRGRHLFPGVKFFFAAGRRAKFEEPGSERVDVEGPAVEL